MKTLPNELWHLWGRFLIVKCSNGISISIYKCFYILMWVIQFIIKVAAKKKKKKKKIKKKKENVNKKKKEKKKTAMVLTFKKWPFPAGFNIKTQDGKLPSVVCKYCSRGRLQWFYVRS